MTAQIIDIGRARYIGNGAREALIGFVADMPDMTADDAASWADWLLAEFWMRGLKVVPLHEA